MTFQDSIRTCFSKYVDFSGRASRSEYWWFFLFVLLACMAAMFISDILYYLVSLGTLLPSLAAGARRLHDTGRSGWWQLLWLLPLIGAIILIVLLAQEGKADGDAPLSSS